MKDHRGVSRVLRLACLAFALAGTAQASAPAKIAWGTAPSGQKVFLYTLKNGGLEARVATYGGILVDLVVPDANGKPSDVVQGFGTLAGYTDPAYIKASGHYGAIIGRFANRIAGARFALDGKTYALVPNSGANQIHGGPDGFDKRVWRGTARAGADPSVTLTLVSPDGDQGFPGTLTARVTYTLGPHALRIDYRATTDKPTVVNLTNHSYFNLDGAGSGSVLSQQLQIFAHRYTVAGVNRIPTGEIAGVAGTALDFLKPKAIGADIAAPDIAAYHGYDHNFVLDGTGLKHAARVEDPVSGRVMDVWTTQPGMQLFVAPDKPGFVGREGAAYPPRGAFCLETQHFPDSPNEPDFPSTEVTPAKPYRETTIFKFSTMR